MVTIYRYKTLVHKKKQKHKLYVYKTLKDIVVSIKKNSNKQYWI